MLTIFASNQSKGTYSDACERCPFAGQKVQKTGTLPNSVAPLAEMLRLNGYSTGAFGKWHETAAWETSLSGPFDRWPTHQGFDKFYGFIGGETDQWCAPDPGRSLWRLVVVHEGWQTGLHLQLPGIVT